MMFSKWFRSDAGSTFLPILLYSPNQTSHYKISAFAPSQNGVSISSIHSSDYPQRTNKYSSSCQQDSCVKTPSKPWPVMNAGKVRKVHNLEMKRKRGDVPKIAIIGGGIAGVTAAKSILEKTSNQVEITIYESDPTSLGNKNDTDEDSSPQPQWQAATARNANSLVPGAAMHILSQKRTIYNVLRDSMKNSYNNNILVKKRSPSYPDFSFKPPYFGINLWNCLGWNVSWGERLCFLNFMYYFLSISLRTSDKEAVHRGNFLVQLAKANRFALNKEFDSDKELRRKLGAVSGFISIHRTQENAQRAVEEAREFGEEADILSFDDAVDLEPIVQKVPLNGSYYVHRPNDQTANCAEYIRLTVKSLKAIGVVYQNDCGAVDEIERIKHDDFERFRIHTVGGYRGEYDYVILAAGTLTPLLASKVSIRAALACPVYPLRGFSLTLSNGLGETEGSQKKGISFDNIYCTSIFPYFVRLAGFGEIVGFPNKRTSGLRSPATEVLRKYANSIFGDQMKGEVISCFRPMSPDDLPVVGEINSVPGLFVHTGHGTLGWTMCLATADCVAQTICEKIEGTDVKSTSFLLRDGTAIPRVVLNPDRFV
jgi:glycine/D-amino acid oxidase-like deaminating enzyme